MPEHPHEGRVIPVDPATGDDTNPLPGVMPLSLDEVDDYLYDESRPTEERIERLNALRDNLLGLAASDLSGDTRALIEQIDGAVATLMRGEETAPEDAAVLMDPADHLESYSPDDEEGIENLAGGDAADVRTDETER